VNAGPAPGHVKPDARAATQRTSPGKPQVRATGSGFCCRAAPVSPHGAARPAVNRSGAVLRIKYRAEWCMTARSRIDDLDTGTP